jgi:glycosyltransferase involved in cell wall biosynthesis
MGAGVMQLEYDTSPLLPITCVILTKNEEKAIGDCLDSVDFCEQIIVVDSNSTDMTSKIVRNFGSELIHFTWNGRYPKKKQWALQHPQVRNDWILLLDADERVSVQLKSEIVSLFQNGSIAHGAFDVEIAYQFTGKMLRHGHKVRKRILLNRKFCSFPALNDLSVKNMWEVEGHYQPIVSGSLGFLSGKLFHSDPDDLYDYFARHNRYSDWEAYLRINDEDRQIVRRAKSYQGRIFDVMPGKPLIFFLYSYLLKLGFLDGKAGLNYALSLAFYYWQISLKVNESKNVS